MPRILDWNKYLETAAQAAAEGIVMLRNDNFALPLHKDDKVAVFGRIQLHYYKSGTGSGGMVNVSKVTGITDGLIDAGISVDTQLLELYRKWDRENPFDLGGGWGAEPWSQKEMPLPAEAVEGAAQRCNAAVVIIGRTAGEEQDASEAPGSYLLSQEEKDMLTRVRSAFDRMIVLLNVGGLIDLEYIESAAPDALMIVWQGGMTGGTGAAAVLTGKTSPSGHLTDTIAYKVSDYPSDKDFGGMDTDVYREDIYMGYRWFETFAPQKVRYPFGYGLSYTTFSTSVVSAAENDGVFELKLSVENTGSFCGMEVVQLYVQKPQGKLGQPARVLCGYDKTAGLDPGQSQTLELKVEMSDLASYDDSGVTGYRSCWVLEEGEYVFFIGSDVRRAEECYTVTVPVTVKVKECEQALAPVTAFRRIRPEESGGQLVPVEEDVPLRLADEYQRRLDRLPEEIPYTGDKGIKLADVAAGRNTMDEFIAQLSDYDLSCIIRGEGMGGPRVTAGTASAFGGVTDELSSYGIPAACCDDGPSGMRLDCGEKAFSLPNGTLLASTFDRRLIKELFGLMGLEMAANNVDSLLGPGMNLHRHPLNGRNFEYFSEDPYLSGTIAAAELQGLHSSGVTGTIKHFCGNNQEKRRHFLDSVISERALRELYLKGFEIAVRSGGADTIMTTYGKVNGVYTCGNYDLNTTILRRDWGYTGLTMSDWWANINRRGQKPDRSDFAAMAMAQNDLYMVCAESRDHEDNTLEELEKGNLRRSELQRNAKNICGVVMNTYAMQRLMGTAEPVEIVNRPAEDCNTGEAPVFYDLEESVTVDLGGRVLPENGAVSFVLNVYGPGWFNVAITASSDSSDDVSLPLNIYAMGTANGTLVWGGTSGEPVTIEKRIPLYSRYSAIRLIAGAEGLRLHSISFTLVEKVDNIEIAFGEQEEDK